MFVSYFSFAFSVLIDILLLYMLLTLVFPKVFLKCGQRRKGGETGYADSGEYGEGRLMAAARPHPLNILSWSPQKRYRAMAVSLLVMSNILHLVKNVIYFLYAYKQASCFVKSNCLPLSRHL
jgi:hypothetical protein